MVGMVTRRYLNGYIFAGAEYLHKALSEHSQYVRLQLHTREEQVIEQHVLVAARDWAYCLPSAELFEV